MPTKDSWTRPAPSWTSTSSPGSVGPRRAGWVGGVSVTGPRWPPPAAARAGRSRTARRPGSGPPHPSWPGRSASASNRSQGAGDRVDVGGVDHVPGLAVHHRLGGSAAVAGHLGHACGSRLEEDDAEALLLEAAPPAAAEHGVDVGGAVDHGQVLLGHPAEERHRRTGGDRPLLEPFPVAARIRRWRRAARAPGASRTAASIRHVHPLAGDEAAEAEHERPVVEAVPGADLRLLAAVERSEAAGCRCRTGRR